MGQEAKELLRLVGKDSSGARQSTNIDASALETQREIFNQSRGTLVLLGNWNEATLGMYA